MAKCAIISPQLLLHCLYSMGGIIQHIYISVLSENLKTSKPQNLKTSKPQNPKTSKPQNLKTSKPQNLKTSLCSITTVSVSYADTFSFRSKVNTLKPRSAREKEKAAF
ncbi:hypothetical protein [Dialister hominis]|uniref:hypothetical protein n=1 Tax=Dialister hominis TaxID=2582419 RepID=UPI004027D2E0